MVDLDAVQQLAAELWSQWTKGGNTVASHAGDDDAARMQGALVGLLLQGIGARMLAAPDPGISS